MVSIMARRFRVPIRKGRAQVLYIAAIGPRLVCPSILLDNTDEVEQSLGGDIIDDDVLAGSHPSLGVHFHIEIFDALCRYESR